MEANKEIIETVNTYKYLRGKIDSYQSELNKTKDAIMTFMGDENELRDEKNILLATKCTFTQDKFDSKEFKVKFFSLFEEYKKPVEVTKLIVK